jgi:predicted nucleic acid-binding protein
VIAYLDSSVVARKLLGEADSLDQWEDITEAYASRLMPVELGRLIDRLRLSGVVDDEGVAQLHEELRRVVASMELVSLTAEILATASGALPTVLSTLDAIHLASALEVQRRMRPGLVMTTHDVQLGRGARAVGLPVIGLPAP